MNILLVEDDKDQVEGLLKHIHASLGTNVRVFGPYDQFSSVLPYVHRRDVSLAIIDIQLHNDLFAGIHIAEMIQELLKIPVLFVSGVTDEAVIKRANQVENSAFLQKPYDTSSFNRAITCITEITESKNNALKIAFRPRGRDRYWIKTDRASYIGLSKDDILCVEAMDHYCRIYVAGSDAPLITKASLKRDILQGGLSQYDHFYQINRSTVVNLNHVVLVEGNVLHIEGLVLLSKKHLVIPKERREEVLHVLGITS